MRGSLGAPLACLLACTNESVWLDASKLDGARSLIVIDDAPHGPKRALVYEPDVPLILERLERRVERTVEVHAFLESLAELSLVEGPVVPSASGRTFPAPLASFEVSLEDAAPAWSEASSAAIAELRIATPCRELQMKPLEFPQARVGFHVALELDEDRLLLSLFDATIHTYDFATGFSEVEKRFARNLSVTVDAELAAAGRLIFFEYLSTSGGAVRPAKLAGNVLEPEGVDIELAGFLVKSWAGGAIRRVDPLEIVAVSPNEQGTKLLRVTETDVQTLDVDVAIRRGSTALARHGDSVFVVTSSSAGLFRVTADGVSREDLPTDGSGTEVASIPGLGLTVGFSDAVVLTRTEPSSEWRALFPLGARVPGTPVRQIIPTVSGFLALLDGLGDEIYEYLAESDEFCRVLVGPKLGPRMAMLSGRLVLISDRGLEVAEP
ncbi:MAG: hypothetical protein HY791_20420 [Deltaproteobacteria bacterium]|nr:hypothetical protein [Deltaproteobacteria bacterium]